MLSPNGSTLTLPFTVFPTLARQAGDGRHKFAAAASVNSLFDILVSGPGHASSQADDTLSRCFHAHAALVVVGLTKPRAFVKIFDLVHSIASTIFFLVAPVVQPPPRLSRWVESISGVGSWRKSADWVASSWILDQDLLISPAMLQSEARSCLHLF